jgi:hypothetical protein
VGGKNSVPSRSADWRGVGVDEVGEAAEKPCALVRLT